MIRRSLITFFILLSFSIDVFSQKADTSRSVNLYVKPHSTVKSVLLSAVIPGAGQIYNGQKIKSIIAVGGIAALSYAANIQNKRALDSESDIEREYYKGDRDRFIIYAVLFYFLNIIDAYVDAELRDFDTGPDLSMISGRNQFVGVQFNWSF